MYRKLLGGGAILMTLVACNGDQQGAATVEAPAAGEPATAAGVQDAPRAQAIFRNTQGTEIGRATLTEEPNGVRIDLNLAFLQAGERGFHIHAVGSCEAPSFDSAGGHFNPTDRAHGFNHPEGPHAGDLPNLEVETDDGTARANFVVETVTLVRGQPNSLLDDDGSSLVVHAEADDYETQPTGNSGARIACAVIEAV
jgi:superoxide dismutase, Cu-Zn family